MSNAESDSPKIGPAISQRSGVGSGAASEAEAAAEEADS